jgi:hypothetical protein
VECRAAAEHRFDPDAAAMHLHDLLGDREPKTGSAFRPRVGVVDLLEGCLDGTAPDEHTEMRYPTRASKLVHRRLQVPPSPLHDPSCIQLHACTPGEELPRALCLTWDIRVHYPGCRYPYDARRAVSLYIGAHEQRSRSAERRRRYWQARIPLQLAHGEAAARFRDRFHGTIPGRMWREIGNDFSVLNRPGE